VQDLAVLDAAAIRKMEPNVVGTSALWSPNTGIVDYGYAVRVSACCLLQCALIFLWLSLLLGG
jgi:L-2-hydroxyglutarate oxidase LhgO